MKKLLYLIIFIGFSLVQCTNHEVQSIDTNSDIQGLISTNGNAQYEIVEPMSFIGNHTMNDAVLNLGNVDFTANKAGDVQNYTMNIPSSAEPPPLDIQKNTNIDKRSKIIKDGSILLDVKQLEVAKLQVDTLIKEAKGYYENEKFNSYGKRTSYTLKIRVPNEHFESLISILEKGVGKLVTKNISSRDVTEEYTDLSIRLENNMSYLKQYQQLLKRAGTIKEILEVQEKIRNLEEEIDSKKGRIQFIDDKVKYSTLNLELTNYQEDEIMNVGFVGRVSNAFKYGFLSFLNFITISVSMWPFIVLIVTVWLFRKRLWRLVRKK